MGHELAKETAEALSKMMDDAIGAAFDCGHDFVASRSLESTGDAFMSLDVRQPARFTLSLKAGPVERGSEWNAEDWIVYRRPDDWPASDPRRPTTE